MSQNNWPFVINVGNSIIGVTVLAMPFCFQACGIILGTLLLLFATWLTTVSCQLLMKAGVTSRRRSYSLLAFFTHGALGKLIVEVGMIGLQLGTLIAQIVIIGDLGPAIVSKATGLQNNDNLRTGLIVVLCSFVGLPLGLLKDVRTLSKTSTLCILFYAFFTCYIVTLSIPNLIKGDWYNKVNFWRMEGFFQCLPIFSFAFGCQTQLFIVYDALADPSLKRINGIVSSAVNMCTVSYLLVGFFGYIAFCNVGDLSGDIINHFRQDSVCDVIKLLFVFSIAVTIPLIVFPCRTSLYTLCFPHAHKTRDDVPGGGKMPEVHFKVITIIIIVGSMIIGILIPNIEFVLGINGATMGTLICYIFPALFFLSVMSDKAEGLFTGKVVLAFGLTIMIASTYTILTKESTEVKVDPLDTGDLNPVIDISKIESSRKFMDNLKGEMAIVGNESKVQEKAGVQERQEPPIPQEPLENIDKTKKETDDKVIKIPEIDKKDIEDTDTHKQSVDKEGDNKPKESEKAKDADIDDKNDPGVEKKEDKDVAKQEEKMKEAEKKQDEILAKLEQQQEQQEKLIQEQKEILEQLKEHKDSHKDDEVAPNPANIQLPLNQDQGGKVIPGNAAQNMLDQKVNVQIPVQNQQDALQFQQNNPADGQILQQNVQGVGQNIPQNVQVVQNIKPNVQGAGGQNLQNGDIGHNVQPNVQGVAQNNQQNVQGLGQNLQQNVQGLGQNLQQNVQGLGQNLQQNVQGLGQNIQQNVQGGQNFQQNLQGGGQNLQQNMLAGQNVQVNQNLQPNVLVGQNLQQNVQDGLNLQQNVQGGLNLQQNLVKDNAQIYQEQNQQQFEQGQVKKQQLAKDPVPGNVQNVQQNVVRGDNMDNNVDNIELKHRGKRESDVIENNVVNELNNEADAGKQVNVDTQIDTKNKVNADVRADDGDGDHEILQKENNGQRDLKQVHTYAKNAQFGSDSYINKVLNDLKYNDAGEIGKQVLDKIGMLSKVKRRL